jgi:rhamnose transport system permease protein
MLRTLVAGAGRWETFLLALVVAVFVAGASSSAAFLTASNQSVAAGAFMERAVIALPMMVIILMGEIDLSVAAVLALSSCIFGLAVEAGVPLLVAILAAIGLGALAGAFNGLLIVRVGLPSLVVTLGTLALFGGLAQAALGDRQITDLPTMVQSFGYENVPGTWIPWPVVVFLVLLVPFAVVLHGSRLGREIYAIGNNAETSRYSGIHAGRIRFGAFVLSGALAAVAGLMLTARLGTVRPDNGAGFLLDVIAVVLLGGVSIFGGKGTLGGVVLALVLLLALQNSLSLNNVSTDEQQLIVGCLLIVSVLMTTGLTRVQAARRNRAARRLTPAAAGPPAGG